MCIPNINVFASINPFSRNYVFKFFLGVFLTMMLMACAREKSAGSATEITNGLAGTFQNSDGTAARSQWVYLMQSSATNEKGIVIDSIQTDEEGNWSFANLNAGIYSVRLKGEDETAWVPPLRLGKEEVADLEPILAVPTAVITGKVSHTHLGLFPVFAYIAGTDWEASANDSGAFVLSGIPRGKFTLRVVFRNDDLEATLHIGEYNNLADTLSLGLLDDFRLPIINDTLVLDNFEDANSKTALGLNWWMFPESDPANQVFAEGFPNSPNYFTEDAEGNTVAGLECSGSYYCGLGSDFGQFYVPVLSNISSLKAVSLKIRGTGNGVPEFCLGSHILFEQGLACMDLLNSIPGDWTQITVPWENETLDNPPGTSVYPVDTYVHLSDFFNFNLRLPDKSESSIYLDDIRLIF